MGSVVHKELDQLIEGHRQFHAKVYPKKKKLYQSLSESQSPEVLFITCSDSRIAPELILGAGPGDLFVNRNIGNVVPPAAVAEVDGVAAVIEYAVEVLHVKHAIVCGHSGCGALKATVDRTAVQALPRARRWLRFIEPAFNHRQPLNPADGDAGELAALIRGNVVAQLENLKGQPSVAWAMRQGALAVHGWYYDILSSRIERYDERKRRFVPLLG